MIIQTLGYLNSYKSNTIANQNIYSNITVFNGLQKNLQITKMTTNYKCTVLSIEDKIVVCECLDKEYFKREITCEYKIIILIYFMHICLIILTFSLSEQVLVPRGSDNRGSTVVLPINNI